MEKESHFEQKYINKKDPHYRGLGFIGSNLTRRLVEHGNTITLVDSLIPEYGGNLRNLYDIQDKITVNLSDVRDVPAINNLIKGHHFLFNLAGQTSHLDSMHDPITDLDINAKAPAIYFGGLPEIQPTYSHCLCKQLSIYGKPKYLPVDEKHPRHPVDVNGINKIAGEQYHILYQEVYGIASTVLRLTNTYGPRMRIKDARQTFLGIWIRNLLEGNQFKSLGMANNAGTTIMLRMCWMPC